MILVIDTTDFKHAIVALIDNSKIKSKKKFSAQYKQSEKLLKEIDRLFIASKLKLKRLRGIIVISGPGPFTAVRIGVTVANTLSWSLRIPIAGIKKDNLNLNELASQSKNIFKKSKNKEIVIPHYGKEPNITKSK